MDRPSHLGKYKITDELGKGAMGVVYKGFDPHILRSVAIKTIRKDQVTSDVENILTRFKHEARAGGRLTHPGIVAVYEYGDEGDIAYIVMEYVEGYDLSEYFARGTQFCPDDIVSIMVQLLDALGHAHGQGVIHRDIKPANIILTNSGRIKLTDFGIAHIYSSELTQVGMIMGTPSYMAPEQFQGAVVDRRCDLYSSGVLLFQLLTGKKPFQGPYEQMAYSVCHTQAPLPSSVIASQLALQFDSIVEKALEKNPEDRFASAQAFKVALMAAFSAPIAETVSEKTRIFYVTPESPSSSQGQPKSLLSGSGSSNRSLPPAGWDATLLKSIERQLATFVGPLAHIMVKKVATVTTDLNVLYAKLADELEIAEERKAFLDARMSLNTQASGTSHSSFAISHLHGELSEPVHIASGEISQEMIDKAVHDLAPFLGPIAKVVVKRTAAESTSLQQLYLILSDNLTDGNDRERFLKSVGFNTDI